jgi:hypothetical protein
MTKSVDINPNNVDKNSSKVSRLDDLNITLMGVENDLMGRALDRSRDEVERAYDFINKAAENDVIEIDCDGCDDESNIVQSSSDEDKDKNNEPVKEPSD